jgi:hypothetical protein
MMIALTSELTVHQQAKDRWLFAALIAAEDLRPIPRHREGRLALYIGHSGCHD